MTALIRAASLADVDALVTLMSAFYREDGDSFDADASRAAFTALLAEPAWGRVWLAEEDGSVIAYVALTLGYSMEFGGRDAFVDDVYVVPTHRGRGVGSALLAECEQACHELGVRALHLGVRPSNRAAALYRRFGFREQQHRLMTKRLTPPHFLSS
jgi:ribosomal protein S18 acetylase RimI-like enzyme